MTSWYQFLQGSHIFTNEQDCSYNTPQLENEALSCPIGVLTQSSMLKTNHNPYPANTQCFVNDQQTIGQASYKRKRQCSFYIYFV